MNEDGWVIMMKIEEIKIALVTLQQDAEKVPPTGLVYLATYLNERVGLKKENIRIFDNNMAKNIEQDILKFSPNIIGLTSMTVDYGKIIRFTKTIKKKTSAKIILGGVHVSTLPESLNKVFDMGVIGEGEETLGDIIRTYANFGEFKVSALKKIKSLVFFINEKIIMTSKRPPIELDSLPIPNFKFADKKYFRLEEIPSISKAGIKGYLISSRGCPYRCVFCSTSRFWGKMRFHSPEFTAKIVKRFVDDFGCNYLKVMDDLFTVSSKRIRKIREAFEKEGIMEKINGIECQPRANLITDELCREMKKIKIKTINFGFESGSHRMLNWLKQQSVDPETNMKAIKLCSKYGFKIYGSLIYGSPNETIWDMEETNKFIDFAAKNGATYIWSFIATPFPATPFWDIALERGKVSNDMDWDILSHHKIDDPLLLDENVDREEFKRVFLKGRKKLRKMKLKLIKEFARKNLLLMAKLTLNDPKYYLSRIYKQIIKQ